MTGEAAAALLLASLPFIGVGVSLSWVYGPRLRRRRRLRKLDESFEQHRWIWEDELRGMGDQRSPESPA